MTAVPSTCYSFVGRWYRIITLNQKAIAVLFDRVVHIRLLETVEGSSRVVKGTKTFSAVVRQAPSQSDDDDDAKTFDLRATFNESTKEKRCFSAALQEKVWPLDQTPIAPSHTKS